MKVALVGIGKIAVDQHVPAIANSDDWELSATVSRNGSVEGVPAFTDLGEMLSAHPEVRVVSLCLPPVPRFDSAMQALRAGRHVMLEKPPGATIAECHALDAAAREAGLTIYATWHSRHADMVAAAKDWLAKRRLRRMTVTWKEDVRRWHPGQAWIWEPGGLGVFDPGINALSIVTEILPDDIHVASAELDVPSNCQTPIGARIAFHHPKGAEVTATFDWRQDGDQIWRIEAETDDGTLTLADGGAVMAVDGTPTGTAAPLSGEYPRLYAEMAALVTKGRRDMDLRPMVLATDALALGRRIATDPFHD
ncbi:Gfo/Idh/MocA family protein [Thalassococcus sp. BH17M4-6]|uniref:Gfo/Idh/MocA family protein n=1 Tax=Thalassococcus sp. BH17M4-6 TaxID=3413148 RepID=UPI003BD89714